MAKPGSVLESSGKERKRKTSEGDGTHGQIKVSKAGKTAGGRGEKNHV